MNLNKHTIDSVNLSDSVSLNSRCKMCLSPPIRVLYITSFHPLMVGQRSEPFPISALHPPAEFYESFTISELSYPLNMSNHIKGKKPLRKILLCKCGQSVWECMTEHDPISTNRRSKKYRTIKGVL